MRGESIEEGRAEEDEERFERASLRGEELEYLDEGKGLVEPFLGKEIRSAVAGEGRERGEDGREERQVVEELGDELCKEEVSVRREE